MWPGFDSRTRRHMWVEFVVGSRPCSERFFSGYSGFPLSSKTNISKFRFDLESEGHKFISLGLLCATLVKQSYLFIYLFKVLGSTPDRSTRISFFRVHAFVSIHDHSQEVITYIKSTWPGHSHGCDFTSCLEQDKFPLIGIRKNHPYLSDRNFSYDSVFAECAGTHEMVQGLSLASKSCCTVR